VTRDEQVALAAEALGRGMGYEDANDIPGDVMVSLIEDAEAVVTALEQRGGITFGPRA
jgi:hypothetical protein